jgi:OmcA/MtrC family decaheme c-type cytochrome
MEARIVIDEVRHIADNPTLPFLVTGSEVQARREVVEVARCNSCHQDLAFHGGNRRAVEYCVMCHNPSFVSGDLPLEGESESFPSLNFKDLIHQIHASGEYPDALDNCGQCHLDGSAGLPLASNALPSQSVVRTCVEDPGADADDACAELDVQTVVSERPPIAAACLGCHQSESAAVHAEVNTSAAGGESCPTCHQDGRSEGLDRVHALEP